MAGGFMGSQSLPLKVRYGERKREETAAGNKMEKEEKKRPCWNPGKKTEPEENNKIKPADLPHIQTNAVNRYFEQPQHLCQALFRTFRHIQRHPEDIANLMRPFF